MLSLKDDETRQALTPTLGERGRWLSQFRDDWQWASSGRITGGLNFDDLHKTWEEGDAEQRQSALRSVRRVQPELARTWIAEGIDKEKADLRVAFLGCLRTGLSPDDQPLLEERLGDQSEKVRALSAALLALLPSSTLAARMRQRADAMLQAQSAGFLRKKQTLVCSPPEEVDKSWERDGIPKKPPAGMGIKAFWVERILAHVPPSHWVERFDREPAALLQEIAADPFAENVINGWTDATIAFAATDAKSRAWLPALAAFWLSRTRQTPDKGRNLGSHRLSALLSALSPEDAESAVLDFFQEAPADLQGDETTLLNLLHRPWSTNFSAKFLAMLQSGFRKAFEKKQGVQMHQWTNLATIMAGALAPELLAPARDAMDHLDPQKDGDANSFADRWLEEARAIIRRRELFYQTIRQSGADSTTR
jgi:hypothetical protein